MYNAHHSVRIGLYWNRQIFGDDDQNLIDTETPIDYIFWNFAPMFAVVGLSGDASSLDVLLLFFSAIEEFKFVKIGPGVSQIWIYFDCPVKPIPALWNFVLAPKKPVNERIMDMRVSQFPGSLRPMSVTTRATE